MGLGEGGLLCVGQDQHQASILETFIGQESGQFTCIRGRQDHDVFGGGGGFKMNEKILKGFETERLYGELVRKGCRQQRRHGVWIGIVDADSGMGC